MSDTPQQAPARRRWQEILLNRRMVVCILQGFSSGMPLYVLIQLVPAWLATEGIDLSMIGLISLAMTPYNLKFLWAPLLDRYGLAGFGHRRTWMLLTQFGVLGTVAVMGLFPPEMSMQTITALVFLTAVFSATQDIALDAYRRERLSEDEFGPGNSLFVNAYRLSSLVPGALALILADFLPCVGCAEGDKAWAPVFLFTAAFMFVGLFTTLFVRETMTEKRAPMSLANAVVGPFLEFFNRDGLRPAIAILAFMLLYKLGDNMAVALATPFYIDIGFSLTEIGTIAKVAALWASIAGGVLGGIIMLKISINRALWLFGVVQVVSILGFWLLAVVGYNRALLLAVVSFEYIGVGLGTVALTTFIARTASTSFTATQLALLTALATLPRTVATASTGYIIEAVGWPTFFLICAAVALPGMLLLLVVAPWNVEDSTNRIGGGRERRRD